MALYKGSVRVAGAGSEVAVSSTAPSSPTEGKLWYDTTNDVLKAYDGTNWNICGGSTYTAGNGINITNDEISVDNTIARTSDINTKTFYISGTSDLTNAQAAYDWLEDGKNPLIVYNNYVYRFAGDAGGYVQFFSDNIISTASTYTQIDRSMLRLDYLNDEITRIRIQNSLVGKFLSTSTDYYEAYTPSYAGSPATKKYVDDNVIQKSSSAPSNPSEGTVWYDTTNDVLKTYDGSNWNEVGSGGAGVITNNTTGTTTAINQEWCGTETEYGNVTKQEGIVYFTY